MRGTAPVPKMSVSSLLPTSADGAAHPPSTSPSAAAIAMAGVSRQAVFRLSGRGRSASFFLRVNFIVPSLMFGAG